MRDTAMGGLVALLVQPEWRSDRLASAIADAVRSGLRDDNALVRMRAAEGVLALHADKDAEQRAAAIGELLLNEQDPAVRGTLLQALAATAHAAPAVVDEILSRVEGESDSSHAQDDDLRGDVTVDLLTYLAVVAEMPYASETVERWCEQVLTRPAGVCQFAHCARRYMETPDVAGQRRLFEFLRPVVETCAARLTRDPAELLTSTLELSEAQVTEIQGAMRVCHDVAEQIYFASGAFEIRRDPTAEPAVPHPILADLAMPVLAMCASTRVAQCVHPAVQTMVFWAPLDEAGTLRAIADAVPADSSYAGDPLAGDVVVTYLQRLLTEQRPLVLFDAEGSEAFRRLLATFAAAGNQGALALAYTFADVFR
jgi:hypothetical protein